VSSEIATVQDFNISRLEGKFKALKSDIILSDAINRNTNIPLDEFINMICTGGNTKQRNALARKLTIKDGLALESTEALINKAKDKVVTMQIYDKCIADNIVLLAETFGCEFKGDLLDVADVLRNAYKYFSLLDWNLFFNYCKDGRYKTEYQNISVRGINLEFLNEWVKQYDGERDEAIAAANHDYKAHCINIPTNVASEFLAKQKEVENKNKRLTELREAWSKESKFKQGKDGIGREPKLESVETALMLFSNVTKEAMKEYIYTGIDKALTERQQYAYYSTMLRRMFFKLKNADYQSLIKVFAVATNRAELADKMVIDFENKLDAAFATYRDEQIELNKDKSLVFVMTKKELGVYHALQQFKKHNLSNPLI
jgi:hypothetical protein